MKKILCFILTVMILASCAACGESKPVSNNNSEQLIVDEKTVSIVNKAFSTTGETLKTIDALGYERNLVVTVTAEGKSYSTRNGYSTKFVKGDKLLISNENIISSDAVNMESYYYSDGDKIYASTADTTYLITSTDDAKEYLNKLTGIYEFYNTTSVEPINTRVVNTSEGGYGFVLDYPTDKLPEDFDKFFGETIKNYGDTVKPTGLVVSGIIDDKGRLTDETVVYSFTYEYEKDLSDGVDPDNKDADSSDSTVIKVAEVTISLQLSFDYGVDDVSVPDEVKIPGKEEDKDSSEDTGSEDKDDKPNKLKELSLADFQKLVVVNAIDSDNTTNTKK